MRSLRSISRADVAVLVTEAAEVITAQDAHIAGYIHQAFKGMVLVVNKWDLAGELELDAASCTKEILQRLKFFPGVPVLFVSAQFGEGVDQLLPAAQKVFRDRQKRLPTAMLNEEVRRILSSHSPPSVRGRQLKVSYVTQAEVNPPTFVFFVNDPRLLHFSYRRYLENRLREAFGFGGIPLKLIFKRKGKD
jgi:GTP-binding protein